ncbi:MAG TPA: amidohydrolase [Candidatus Tumulicola sp.]
MLHYHGDASCSGCAGVLPLLSAAASAGIAGSSGAAAVAHRREPRSKSGPEDSVTTIYTARRVISMEPGEDATAVAVRGSTIAAVGTIESMTSELEPGTFEIDRRYENDVIVPGLIEQHLHPLLGALSFACTIIAIEDWDVPERFSKAANDGTEYVARLRDTLLEMEDLPSDETLFTWGYHQYFHGEIRRPQLDAISPDRPVVVWHRSCHELILNSAAIAKYGITEKSVSGKGLASEQAEVAQGHFYENGLKLVLAPVGKDMLSPARIEDGVRRFTAYVRSKGITTICEPGTQAARPIQAFWEKNLGGDVGFRTYFIADGRGLYEQHKSDLDALIPATESYLSWGAGNVAWLPQQVKLFCDGAIFSLLMQVQEPYLDGHRGEWILAPVDYAAAFETYWNAGYHIHTHVNGDAGLQVVIDTLEKNQRANPRSDHRFTVVHFAVSQDDQVRRLKELGAIVSANPYYPCALADKYSHMGLGPERANSMARLGTAVREGVSISLHSDMPMAPADPLFLMWCAVNRITPSGRTADPEQRIDAESALRAVTIDAAYSIELENEIGSIKPGKKADLTILSDDPLLVDPREIRNIRVVDSIFAGRRVSGRSTGLHASVADELHGSHAVVSKDVLASPSG